MLQDGERTAQATVLSPALLWYARSARKHLTTAQGTSVAAAWGWPGRKRCKLTGAVFINISVNNGSNHFKFAAIWRNTYQCIIISCWIDLSIQIFGDISVERTWKFQNVVFARFCIHRSAGQGGSTQQQWLPLQNIGQ